MTYVGLTDDPKTRKAAHGNPSTWKIVKTFTSEKVARIWEKAQAARMGYTGGGGGEGWKNGYTYTITISTKQ